MTLPSCVSWTLGVLIGILILAVVEVVFLPAGIPVDGYHVRDMER
jgi:hypothetical protein